MEPVMVGSQTPQPSSSCTSPTGSTGETKAHKVSSSVTSTSAEVMCGNGGTGTSETKYQYNEQRNFKQNSMTVSHQVAQGSTSQVAQGSASQVAQGSASQVAQGSASQFAQGTHPAHAAQNSVTQVAQGSEKNLASTCSGNSKQILVSCPNKLAASGSAGSLSSAKLSTRAEEYSLVATNSSIGSCSSTSETSSACVVPVSSTCVVSVVSALCSEDAEGEALTLDRFGTLPISVSSSCSTVTSSYSSDVNACRSSNPRQSTLTRSHAITLDEDSDGQVCCSRMEEEDNPPNLEQEHELIQFIIDTCNRSAKDRNFVLRIEADLIQFVKDETRLTLPFPQMSSYQRMLVHRMATLFELDHNVDTSSGGNFVVVSKNLDTVCSSGRIPPLRFKELQTPSSHGDNSDSATPIAELLVPEVYFSRNPPTNNVSSTSSINAVMVSSATKYTATAASKKILKRERPCGVLVGDKKCANTARTKSLEERTQDYNKARRRIFEDFGGDDGCGGEPTSGDTATSSKKLNWSSTDSSEDRMYLKPPFPDGSTVKLMKVESFESASQKKSSNRDARQMGKSHSFGGYEDSQHQLQPHYNCQQYSIARNRGSSAFNSNNASSLMMSCSSSSSLRSSSFSKQDSSSSTTSGSGQSPSGGTSSGYKSSGSCGALSGGPSIPLTTVSGYYSSSSATSSIVGISPTVETVLAPVPVPLSRISAHQVPSVGSVVCASAPSTPLSHNETQQILCQNQLLQTPHTGAMSSTIQNHSHVPTHLSSNSGQGSDVDDSSSPSQQNQQVMFCCWAVADVNNVPPGAIILDPSTGQAVKNTDGSQYFYDPLHPPKFVNTVPLFSQQSLSGSITNQQQQASSQHVSSTGDLYSESTSMFQPPIAGAPPTTVYNQHQNQSAQSVTSPSGVSCAHSASYMTLPVPNSAIQDVHQQHQIQDLSGYFSHLSVGLGSSGGRPPSQVVYVPLEALGGCNAYQSQAASSVVPSVHQEPPTSQQHMMFYELDPTEATSNPHIPATAAALHFQNSSGAPTGYLIQQVVDTAGTGSLYYYGGNLVPTAAGPVASVLSSSVGPVNAGSGVASSPNSSTIVAQQNSNHQRNHQYQPRYKNWVVPTQQPVFSMHHPHNGFSSQQGPQSQPRTQPSAASGPSSTILIHPNAPSTAGLVPTLLHGAIHQSQLASPASQQSPATLVPLGFHSSGVGSGSSSNASGMSAHNLQGAVTAQQQPHTMVQTMMPISSPVYRDSVPAPTSPYPSPTQPHQYSPSFVPPQPIRNISPASQHQYHRYHSASSPNVPPHIGHQINSGHKPRYISLSNSTAAATASAVHQQQQILFAAAAAAMAMSSNYPVFPNVGAQANSITGSAGANVRNPKGGIGRGNNMLQHASVTSAHVPRRSAPKPFSRFHSQ